MFSVRWLCCLVGLTLFVTMPGCGGSRGYNGPKGNLAGKVTVAGKPVSEGGTVQFQHESGYATSARIGAGGSYAITGARVGAYKVAVFPVGAKASSQQETDPDKLNQMIAAGTYEGDTASDEVPAKYQSVDTSGLTADVAEGDGTKDFQL